MKYTRPGAALLLTGKERAVCLLLCTVASRKPLGMIDITGPRALAALAVVTYTALYLALLPALLLCMCCCDICASGA